MLKSIHYKVKGVFDATVPISWINGKWEAADGLYDVFDFFYTGDDDSTDYNEFVDKLLEEISKSPKARYDFRNMHVVAEIINQ